MVGDDQGIQSAVINGEMRCCCKETPLAEHHWLSQAGWSGLTLPSGHPRLGHVVCMASLFAVVVACRKLLISVVLQTFTVCLCRAS
jgi:hypothetical protein